MVKRNFRKLALVLLLPLALLSGCSTVSHRDGPPHYNVDVSKIPNAVPKVEAKSKYGNLDSYRVFGKRYYTMKSSKNYHERGVASWYGTMFHSRSTSSGEPYNMLAMTAAHKTLPLPTYVQVTNLKNGKKIIVKVNDRGPFEANRVIDLSYVAAKKLGMLGHGTAMVDVKAIDPIMWARQNSKQGNATMLAENTSSHKTSAAHSGAPVFLQVGAFRNKQLAEHLKIRLSRVISSRIIVTQHTRSTKPLYRVEIGPLKDLAAANHITKRLKSFGLSSRKTFEASMEA